MAWTGCEVDGASGKLAVARVAETINLARNDIGAIPDLRPSQPGHLASPSHRECIVLGEVTAQ